MVINYRIDIEPAFIGVLDLAHDLPDHVVVRLAGWRLDFAIDPKSHASLPSVFGDRSAPTSRRSSDTKVNAFAVMPCTSPAWSTVITVTSAAKRPAPRNSTRRHS